MSWVENGPPPIVEQATDFQQYAYGVLLAAHLAARLSLPSISVLELGVAGGNGLVELERLAAILGANHGIDIEVAGFDLGDGMPTPVDYRDSPYAWQKGFFAMDEPLLRSRLQRAELAIGDIAITGRAFLERSPAPIGFISFDLDYYSSTVAAFAALLDHKDLDSYLPRVVCYFDDTVGPHSELHSDLTGELLAIREFNEMHRDRKLAPIHGLRYKLLPLEGPWVAGIYVLHLFEHPLYDRYVHPDPDRQFPLEQAT